MELNLKKKKKNQSDITGYSLKTKKTKQKRLYFEELIFSWK